MVPPQVSPTAKAWSSEYPKVHSRGRPVGAHEELGAQRQIGTLAPVGALGRHLDDGRQRHRLLGQQRVAKRLVEAHQSSGSTSRWIVPPQVRPTAKASSSE